MATVQRPARETFKPWHQRTLEQRQDRPGELRGPAQQGPISPRSEEHLVTSDKGIGMQRRMLRRAMEVVAAVGDQPRVVFEEGAVVAVPSENFFAA